MNKIQLFLGDNREILKQFEENSVDAIVTDPPYEIDFMNKKWDSTGIAYDIILWKECLRVLKPGGHLLAFSGSRTYHRMTCAIEDSGFEIRDMINWIYGQGFPKSLNIGKAVDKLRGNEREIIGEGKGTTYVHQNKVNVEQGFRPNNYYEDNNGKFILTKGHSEWEGWGTQLKPAHEPICMARKPISEKTITENVLKWGVGGLAIDNCRIGKGAKKWSEPKGDIFKPSINNKAVIEDNPLGRFPANLIHDGSEEVLDLFPNTPPSKSGKRGLQHSGRHGVLADIGGNIKKGTNTIRGHTDDGGSAARFFYCAKASPSERDEGCDNLKETTESVYPGINSFDGEKNRVRSDGSIIPPLKSKNNHPTIKPIALMKYLMILITKEEQIVLDPFMGSGSTGIACKQINRKFIGIELNNEYIKIAEERIKNAK